MRILLISSEFPPGPGGIGTHAYELARGFVELGHDIEAVVGQDYVEPEMRDAWNLGRTFPVFPLAPAGQGGRFSRARDRLAVIRRRATLFRPDVILATGDPAVYWAGLANLLAGSRRVPILAVEHGRVAPGPEAGLKRWSFRRADHVVAVSAYSLSRLAAQGVRAQVGSVIHNGADVDYFRPASAEEQADLRGRYGLGDAPLLLTVGSVHARKGQDLVVRALPQILEEHPDTLYLVAGLGHEADALKGLAQELGVAERVRLLGPVSRDELRQLYGTCDLFLMTSRNTKTQFEGFGIAAVEAALCGRPAVVSGDSGLQEAVVDGETGRVVPQENPAAIAEAACELLAAPEMRARWGEAAERRARADLSWLRAARAYARVMAGLVDGAS